MWGGFQEPRSRLSAVYQVILGFILMIVVAAYTANLAAFMTVSSLPSLGIASLEELILANEPACVPSHTVSDSATHSLTQAHSI